MYMYLRGDLHEVHALKVVRDHSHTWNWSQNIRNEDFNQSLIKKVITCFDECHDRIKFTQLQQFGLGQPTLIFSIIPEENKAEINSRCFVLFLVVGVAVANG